FLTISGKEFLPSQGVARPIVPEVIELDRLLETYGISRGQLIDLGILVGTDFNEGVKGIGPKKALKLVQEHGRIERMPSEIVDALGDVEEVRRIYTNPNVTDDYDITFGEPDIPAVVDFLCRQREFGEDRVRAALDRAFRERTLW